MIQVQVLPLHHQAVVEVLREVLVMKHYVDGYVASDRVGGCYTIRTLATVSGIDGIVYRWTVCTHWAPREGELSFAHLR